MGWRQVCFSASAAAAAIAFSFMTETLLLGEWPWWAWGIAGLFFAVVAVWASMAEELWIALKRWLLPKAMVEMRDELVATRNELEGRIAELETLKKGTARADYEKGYEVLNWWGETGEIKTPIQQLTASITKDLIGGRKRYPRTILVRKTGQIKELPYPPTANKIPESTSTR